MARRPLLEPKRVSVSCSLERVRNSLCSSAKRGQRWRMCSCTASGLGGGHIATFTVPGDVEPVVVVCIETVHGTQLDELPEDFEGSFELAECFAGFGVRRLSGAVPKSCSEGQGLVGFSLAPLFGFFVSEFIDLYSLMAWDPGYMYVGIVISL